MNQNTILIPHTLELLDTNSLERLSQPTTVQHAIFHLQQYSLSKCYQISRMTVIRSLSKIFRLVIDPYSSYVITLILYAFPAEKKKLTLFALWQVELSSYKLILLSPS